VEESAAAATAAAEPDDEDEDLLDLERRRVAFLDHELERMYQAIEEIREIDGYNLHPFTPQEVQESGDELCRLHMRLDRSMHKFQWLQNSIGYLQEFVGLPRGYYSRLPNKWEAPPPKIFRSRGIIYNDFRPVMATPSGPAGRTGDYDEGWIDGEEVVSEALHEDWRQLELGERTRSKFLTYSQDTKFRRFIFI
jgi:hypothetical protein